MQPNPNFLAAYCERMGSPLFWAEPLNALTNGAFLIAVVFIFRHWVQKKPRDCSIFWLTIILIAIGIGSFMFHTIPNITTLFMDVIPIQLFILVSFGLALRRFLHVPIWGMIIGPLLLFVISMLVPKIFGGRALGGSIGYLPTLISLFGLAFMPTLASLFGLSIAIRLRSPEARRSSNRFALCGVLFALSLTLRSLDQPLCGFWPYGLHFLWHMLNACVLFVVLFTLMQAGRVERGG